jgi:hypothetical protein
MSCFGFEHLQNLCGCRLTGTAWGGGQAASELSTFELQRHAVLLLVYIELASGSPQVRPSGFSCSERGAFSYGNVVVLQEALRVARRHNVPSDHPTSG